MVPHVIDEIKAQIEEASKGVDISIVEIGGTVGDIESLPFLEAIRQYRHDHGRENSVCAPDPDCRDDRDEDQTDPAQCRKPGNRNSA